MEYYDSFANQPSEYETGSLAEGDGYHAYGPMPTLAGPPHTESQTTWSKTGNLLQTFPPYHQGPGVIYPNAQQPPPDLVSQDESWRNLMAGLNIFPPDK